MTKTLFILGTLLLLIAGPSLATQSADLDWGRIKTLYNGDTSDVIYDRSGSVGTLTPLEPTLTAPEHAKLAFVLGVIQEAQQQRPDLEIWRDRELQELLEGCDRGAGDWFKKVGGWIREHVQFSMNGSGWNFQINSSHGCIVVSIPWGFGGGWSIRDCL
jgi:hypothetical protein